jgi:hypothetical protein
MNYNYQRLLPQTSGYIITGYDMKLYCKLTESNIDQLNYKCVISFGTGMKKWCITALYDKQKPNELYIDRVENNDLCTIDTKLRNYEKGTIKVVKIALCVLKQLFPDVTKLSLHDDSQIYCDEKNKIFKLSLSYDYILKYNESWYQKLFSAELPGFISKKYTNTGKYPTIISESDSLMEKYTSSLKELDEPIMDYSLIINIFPLFSEYKVVYESSSTPREFINTLRKTLKNDFCFKVGKWLNQYMLFLQIKLSPEYWYISATNIEKVPNFTMTKLDNSNTRRILSGGSNKTRKNVKKTGIRIISDSNFTDTVLGSYDEYN